MTYKFTSVEFMTAKEKETVIKNWIKFLVELTKDKGDNFTDKYGNEMPKLFQFFTKRLYEHLHLHCEFIAHYNQWGFFQEYFSGDITDLKRFFGHFETTSRYMDDYQDISEAMDDYQDINEAMSVEYLKVKDKIFNKADEETDDKFELLKELVKRAETDKEMREKLITKFF